MEKNIDKKLTIKIKIEWSAMKNPNFLNKTSIKRMKIVEFSFVDDVFVELRSESESFELTVCDAANESDTSSWAIFLDKNIPFTG